MATYKEKMHTFSLVVQAIINKPYPFKIPLEMFDDILSSALYYGNQLKLEGLLPVHEQRGPEKELLINYILKGHVSAKSKFELFQNVLANPFMNASSIENFTKMFSKAQRTYHVLSKFAYTCKFKMAKTLIDKDMYLSPLSESQIRVFAVVQDNKKYLFALTDLVNIINSSLGNAFFFVAEPLPCKNPYTNLPFNKSTLYNIYFFIKRTDFLMPRMLHMFFVCNFNLRIFAGENEDIIRDYSIKQYINGADQEEIHNEIITMLQGDKLGRRIKIDADFPKNKLIDIMKPYLELYYKGTYCVSEVKRDNYIDEYNKKIRRFHSYNTKFGRKYLRKVHSNSGGFNNNYKYIMEFDDNHVCYYEKESTYDYCLSHAQNVMEY